MLHRVFGLLPAVTLTFDLLSPKSNQHICEPKYICDQNWVKFPLLFFEKWYSQVFLGHFLLWPWPLTFWPQNLISTSTNWSTSVTKIGWNSLHWFLRYGVDKFFGSLPAVTLTFDLLTQSLISTCTNRSTSVTRIGWNYLHWFVRYGVQKFFWSVRAVILTFDLLTPKSNEYMDEPKYICDQNWVKFLSLFFLRNGVHKFFWVISCCDLDLWPFDPKV